MGFEATKLLLSKLLPEIHSGNIQLPEFQRDWVWDDQRIKDLLVSVLRKHPIGSVMLLQANNDQARFKTRVIEGVKLGSTVKPQTLVLDGQQRLTSLYQVLLSGGVVETRNDRKQKIKRWYFLDLNKILAASDQDWDSKLDWDEVIVSVPEDLLLRNFRGDVIHDYSSTPNACAAGMMPLSIVMSEREKMFWQAEFLKHNGNTTDTWLCVFERVIEPMQQYQVPVIQLDHLESKEAICKVFEKVNTGGVALDVFELLTATFASDDFDLREDWRSRFEAFKLHPALANIAKTDFLQGISLLVTLEQRRKDLESNKKPEEATGVSCKRKSILDLTPDQYKAWNHQLERGFILAAQFLHEQYIFAARDVPYRTQLVPLATLMALLGTDLKAGARAQLARWYWCGVLGELYGSAVETRFAKDVVDIWNWIHDGAEPATVSDANFAAGRLLSLKTRNSAAYKGVSALLMRDGGLDFLSGAPITHQVYFDAAVDIHHIFPKAWCARNNVDTARCESIVNKTPISAKTNRVISDAAPSIYLSKLEQLAKVSLEEMDRFVASHVINASALRSDDFDAFFNARQEALLQRIETAMGKRASRDAGIELDESDDEETQDAS
jgi:hypothetical protein